MMVRESSVEASSTTITSLSGQSTESALSIAAPTKSRWLWLAMMTANLIADLLAPSSVHTHQILTTRGQFALYRVNGRKHTHHYDQQASTTPPKQTAAVLYLLACTLSAFNAIPNFSLIIRIAPTI